MAVATPKTDTAVSTRAADLDTEQAALDKRQNTLDTATSARLKQQDETMAPLDAAAQSAINAPAPDRPQVDVPSPPDVSKLVDPKEYEGLSYALIGMAMIGGVASKGNWLGVSATLNGALKGYHEGKVEQAKSAMAQYQTEFKAAEAKEKQANKSYEDILNDRNRSINEKLQLIKIEAAKNGREDIRAAAEQKSIDALHRQVESGKQALVGVTQRNESVVVRLETGMAEHEAKAAAGGKGGGKGLTPEGEQFYSEYAQSTGTFPSLFGGKAAVFNMMGAKGLSGHDVATNKASYGAFQNALKNTELRSAAVERLTGVVEDLEPKIVALAEKSGLTGSSLLNTPMNALKTKLGSADLAQLKVLVMGASRSYIEAVTMPGSNAQLHTSSQELSEDLLNSNMGVGQMIGALKGINTDIGAGRHSLNAISAKLTERIRQNGMKLNPEVAGQGGAPTMPGGGGGGGGAMPTKNAKGWTLHVDKNGNHAYVGPNGQIEEVH